MERREDMWEVPLGQVVKPQAGVGRNSNSSCCCGPLTKTSPPFPTWNFQLPEVGSYDVEVGS